jgi:hypothetical protein
VSAVAEQLSRSQFDPLPKKDCDKVEKIKMPLRTVYQLPRSSNVRSQSTGNLISLEVKFIYDQETDMINLKVTNYSLSGVYPITRKDFDETMIDCLIEDRTLAEDPNIKMYSDIAMERLISEAAQTGLMLVIPDHKMDVAGGCGVIYDGGIPIASFREFSMTTLDDPNSKSRSMIYSVEVPSVRVFTDTDYDVRANISMKYVVMDPTVTDSRPLYMYEFSSITNTFRQKTIENGKPLRSQTRSLEIFNEIDPEDLKTMIHLQRYRAAQSSEPTAVRFNDIFNMEDDLSEVKVKSNSDSVEININRFGSLDLD